MAPVIQVYGTGHMGMLFTETEDDEKVRSGKPSVNFRVKIFPGLLVVYQKVR